MARDELEKDVAELKVDVKDILTNHLPHLGKKLARHDGMLVVILVVLGAILTMTVILLRG